MKVQLRNMYESLKSSKTHLIRSSKRKNKTEFARCIFEKKKQMLFFFQIKDKTFQIEKLSRIVKIKINSYQRYTQMKLQKIKDEHIIKPTEGFTGKTGCLLNNDIQQKCHQ